MSSGPDVHPAQAEQRDPPASPTTILLVVGTAILVVIVFALEVMHSQFLALDDAVRPDTSSPGAVVRLEQVSYLQNGEIPVPLPPEPTTARRRGMTIDAAMAKVVEKYGKKGQ